MFSKRPEWPNLVPVKVLGLEIFFPPLKDSRYLIWIFQVSFFVLATTQVHLFRPKTYTVLAVAFLTAAIVDITFLRWKSGKWIFPQSGLITGSGISLLMESRLLVIYAIAALAGVASKHFIKYEGRHIFNPATYGLLFAVSIFPEKAVAFAGQWGAIWWITSLVFILGLVLTYRAKVLDIAIFWLLGFFLVGLCRHLFFGATIYMALGPATGAGFVLFTFYMITDPRTAPKSRWGRFVFCMLTAALDGFFRLQENHYSMFWAIFISYLAFIVMEEVLKLTSRSRAEAIIANG